MGLLFEVPPPLQGNEDEEGYVRLTRQEIDELRGYLERLTQFIADNYD